MFSKFRFLRTVICAVALCSNSDAADDVGHAGGFEYVTPLELRIEGLGSQSSLPVSVVAKASLDSKATNVSFNSIAISVKGEKTINLDREVLQHFPAPQVSSLQVFLEGFGTGGVSKEHDEAQNERFVVVEFFYSVHPYQALIPPGRRSVARIALKGDKVVSLSSRVPVEEGKARAIMMDPVSGEVISNREVAD